mgnify:CR=1 FL=1
MKYRKLKRIKEARNGIQFIVSQEVRDELKPIVFFDAGKFTKDDDGFTIGLHPHSGIGIITYFHGTDLHHKDSGHNNGIIHDGGAQWIRAGKGVWHEEGYHRKHNASNTDEWTGSIHQLWIQLPPDFEESAVEYENLTREEIPVVENVKILSGEYKGVKGKINVPVNMTYLDVYLKKGESWSYQTPEGQTTGYIFTRDGSVQVGGESIPNSKMGILEHNSGLIEVETVEEDAAFILVTSEPSPYPVVSRGGQIHTNLESLEKSLHEIQRTGKNL